MKKALFFVFAAAAVLASASCNKNNGTAEEPANPNTVTYGGVTYKTVTFSNGQTWMAENLRYVPSGKSISKDPADGSGVWAPYTTDGTTCTPNDSLVEKLGLLYSAEVILGKAVAKTDSLSSFEGVQGICPDGWRIPTRADYVKLCGCSNKANGETKQLTDTTALFYDKAYIGAKVTAMNAADWNYQFSGTVFGTAYQKTNITEAKTDVPEFVGSCAMNYYWTASVYQGSVPQLFALMTTFTSSYKQGRVTVGYANATNGCALRCIKK